MYRGNEQTESGQGSLGGNLTNNINIRFLIVGNTYDTFIIQYKDIVMSMYRTNVLINLHIGQEFQNKMFVSL